jgi:3-oxoacyl-[acyl-carrier-protein] synthase II
LELLINVSGAAPITYFDASKFKTQFACELKNFNAEDFLDEKKKNGSLCTVCHGIV